MVDTDIPPMVTTARGLLMPSLRLMLMLVSCTVPMDMVDMLDMDTLPTPTDMPVAMDMDTHMLMVPILIMDKKIPKSKFINQSFSTTSHNQATENDFKSLENSLKPVTNFSALLLQRICRK